MRCQCAALCFRTGSGQIELLLVTSLGSGRWILPKGWPMDGVSHAGAAAREAWEEAGVIGRAHDIALGAMRYAKMSANSKRLSCIATVYPVEVQALADRFPERGLRKRKWFSAPQAIRQVREPELAEILSSFARAFPGRFAPPT